MDDILEEGYSWDNQCWSFENSCYDGYPQEWRALDDHSELENQLDCHSEPELLTADSEVSENEPSLKEEDTLQALGDTDKVSGSEYVLKQLDRMLAQQIQTLRKNPRERLKIVLKARPRCLKEYGYLSRLDGLITDDLSTLGPLRYRTFHWPGLGKTSERQGEYGLLSRYATPNPAKAELNYSGRPFRHYPYCYGSQERLDYHKKVRKTENSVKKGEH